MMVSTNYRNAFKEVSVILSYLKKDEYDKIPKEILQIIENNKDDEYIFDLEEDIELKEQVLLPETKAIIFNLYRDYLCSIDEKEKIKNIQQEARQKIEDKKREKYDINVLVQQDNIVKNEKIEEKLEMIEYKESFVRKLINRIKKIFMK